MFNIGDKVRTLQVGSNQYKTGIVEKHSPKQYETRLYQVHFYDIGVGKHWFYEDELELFDMSPPEKTVDENYSTVRLHVSRMNREELVEHVRTLQRATDWKNCLADALVKFL